MSILIVPRTCSYVDENQQRVSKPLAEFRDLPAYVLLGDPGAGKTTAFKQEAEVCGGQAMRAQDFADLGSKETTVFIDALDETRDALREIRKQLHTLKPAQFRLSCREADWLGSSDISTLEQVSPNGKIVVLHLDPLTEQNVLDILQTQVENPSDFIQQAKNHKLDALLYNPQALALLIQAVGNNAWPTSRQEAYQLACEKLVQEANRAHRNQQRDRSISNEDLLHHAGYLCTLQLLAGINGFALDPDRANQQFYAYTSLPFAPDQLRAALQTKLFTSNDEERFTAIHRSVAEFLAAQYLANLTTPFNRILTLLTGLDGGVFTDLRGVWAWLAVFCPADKRQQLITGDPLAVVLYGDVTSFSVAEKKQLLLALKDEAQRNPQFRADDWSESPFGGLGTADMLDTFREILLSNERSEAQQALLSCVLDAMTYGEAMPELQNALDGMVRDTSYWAWLRNKAIKILARTAIELTVRLANDIYTGTVEDKDGGLLATILHALYPENLSALQVCNFFHPPKANMSGLYFLFWENIFAHTIKQADIPNVLDKFHAMQPIIQKAINFYPIGRMIGQLICGALKQPNVMVATEQLFNWLRLGIDEHAISHLESEHSKQIALWLHQHPARFQSIVEHHISLYKQQQKDREFLYELETHLYNAKPDNIETWYLQKAAIEQDENVAEYFFDTAICCLGGTEQLTLRHIEMLENWVKQYPKLEKYLTPYTCCPLDGWKQKSALRSRAYHTELKERQHAKLTYYRQNREAIRVARIEPHVLGELAEIFRSGEKHLYDHLNNDPLLIEDVLCGFQNSLTRNELPSVTEIVKLATQSRAHHIRSACLLGANQLFQTTPLKFRQLSNELLMKLLAFRLTDGSGNDPDWYLVLLQERSTLVADTFLTYALAVLNSKSTHFIYGLYELANNKTYAPVAQLILPKLLEQFPLRASQQTLETSLYHLLSGAIYLLPQDTFNAIIGNKLSRKSMEANQQIYWLTAGMFFKPTYYLPILLKHIGSSQTRQAAFVYFLYNHKQGISPDTFTPETLAQLFELLAIDAPSATSQTTILLKQFLNYLSNNPDERSNQELQRLIKIGVLSNWHPQLRIALHTQTQNRRKHLSKRLNITDICHVLRNQQPASAADLAALSYDYLLQLARNIRDGNTDDYQQYWNVKDKQPKDENDCRNALLSDLKTRLAPHGVNAEREGSYADDKRADIRVSYQTFNTPIEIKKSNHDDVWGAIHHQLIPRYIRDPGTDGYGIYLVFWFGGKWMKKISPTGKKPKSAAELENAIKLTVSPEQRSHVYVLVIDCELKQTS